MKYQLGCSNCSVTSLSDKKPRVSVDKDRVKQNEESRKEYKDALKEKELEKEKFEQRKKSFWGQYNSYKKEYEEYDTRSFMSKFLGEKPYQHYFDFDYYMWDKHRTLSHRKFQMEGCRDYSFVMSPTILPEKYLVCPVCKNKDYIQDERWVRA